jgi:TP901 family phage tail tape measure protein
VAAEGRLGALSVELLSDVQSAIRGLDVFLTKLDEVKRRTATLSEPVLGGAEQSHGITQLVATLGTLATAVQQTVAVMQQGARAASPLEQELEKVATKVSATAKAAKEASESLDLVFSKATPKLIRQTQEFQTALAAFNSEFKKLTAEQQSVVEGFVGTKFGGENGIALDADELSRITTQIRALKQQEADFTALQQRGAAARKATTEAAIAGAAQEGAALEAVEADAAAAHAERERSNTLISKREAETRTSIEKQAVETSRRLWAEEIAQVERQQKIIADVVAKLRFSPGFKNLEQNDQAALLTKVQEAASKLNLGDLPGSTRLAAIREALDPKVVGQFDQAISKATKSSKEFGDLWQRMRNIIGLNDQNPLRGLVRGFADLILIQARWLIGFQAINAAVGSIRTAVAAVVDLDDELAKVRAIGGGTDAELQKLRATVIDIGKTTPVSATEAAHALILFAQAGFSASESQGALRAAVALSVGGMASLEETVKLLTTVLRAFELSNSDSDRVANVLLATVNKTKASVEGLNTALNFVAPTAASAGLSIETTAAALGALADQGIREATQGTALRQVISALIDPSNRAQNVFKRLGLSIAELNPLTNDFVDVLKRLRDAGFGAQESTEAFGARTGAGVVALVRSADAVERLRIGVTGTQAAFEAQRRAQESLSAQVQILENRFKALAAEMGEDFVPVAKAVVGLLQSMLDHSAALKGVLEATGIVTFLVVLQKLFGALTAGEAVLTGSVAALGGFVTNVAEAAGGLSVFGLGVSRFLIAPIVALGPAVSGAASAIGGVLLAALGSTTAVVLALGAGLAALLVAYNNDKAAVRDFATATNLAAEAVIKQSQGLDGLIDRYEQQSARVASAAKGSNEYDRALKALRTTTAQLISQFPELAAQVDKTTGVLIAGSAQIRDAEKQRITSQIDALERQKEELQKQVESSSFFNIRGRAVLEGQVASIDEPLKKLREELLQLDEVPTGILDTIPEKMRRIREEASNGETVRALDEVREGLTELGKAGQEEFGGHVAEQMETMKDGLISGAIGLEDFKTNLATASPEIKKLVESNDAVFAHFAETVLTYARTLAQAAADSLAISSKLSAAADKAATVTDKKRAELDGLRAELDALNRGLSPEQARVEDANKRATTDIETLGKRLVADAKFFTNTELDLKQVVASLRKGTLEQDFASGPVAENFKNVIRRGAEEAAGIQIDQDKAVTRAHISEAHKRASADTADANALAKARAELAEKQLQDEGRFVDAVRAKYAVLKDEAAKRGDAGKLAALALKEEAELIEAARKERHFQIQEELRLFEIRRQALELENKFQNGLLDLEQRRLDLGLTGGGQAQEQERIDRARLALQQQANADEIAFASKQLENFRLIAEAQSGVSAADRISAEQKVASQELVIGNLQHEAVLLNEQAKLIKQAGSAAVDVGSTLKSALSGVLQSFFDKSVKLKDVLKDAGKSLLKGVTDALAQILIEKAGFDFKVLLNFRGLGEQAGGFLQGGIGQGLTGALGLIGQFVGSAGSSLGGLVGSLFGGGTAAAAGSEAAGGVTQAAGSTIAAGSAPGSGVRGSTSLSALLSPFLSPGGLGGGGVSLGSGGIGSLAGILSIAQGVRGLAGGSQAGSDFGLRSALMNLALASGKGLTFFGPALAAKFPFLQSILSLFGIGSAAASAGAAGVGTVLAPTVTTGIDAILGAGGAGGVGALAPAAGSATPGLDAALGGAPSAAGSGAGLAGAASAVLAVIGAIVSIASAAKGIIDTSKALKKVEEGAPEASSFRTNSLVGLGVATGIGAAVGGIAGLAGGPIGVVVGAAAGATIGATIAQTISSVVAGAVGGSVLDARKSGFSQQQLEDAINSDMKLRIVRGFAGGAGVGATAGLLGKRTVTGSVMNDSALAALIGGPLQGILTLLFDNISKAPSIDLIFDKIFRKAVEAAAPGVQLNRQLGRKGQGVGAAGQPFLESFAQFDPQTGAVVRFIASIIGAGSDNMERVARFMNIIKNSLAVAHTSAAAFKDIIDRIFRGINNNNFFRALRQVQKLFEPPPGLDEGSKRVQTYKNLIKELNEAFGEAFGKGVNVPQLTKDLIEGGFTDTGDHLVKKSRKAVAGAVTSLFEGNDFEEGFNSFKQALGDAMRDALVKGFSKAFLLNGPLAGILVPFFALLQKLMNKAVHGGGKDGLDALLARAQAAAALAGKNIAKVIEDLKPFLEQLREIEQEIEQALKPKLTPEQEANQRTGLLNQIKDQISKAVLALNDAIRAIADAALRLSQKIFAVTNVKVNATDTGVTIEDAGTKPGTSAALEKDITRSFGFFDANKAGLTAEGRVSFLQQLEQQVDGFFQATVQSIKERFQPLIEIAAQAKKIFLQVQEAIKSLKLSAASPLTAREKVDLVQKDIQEQQKILRNSSDQKARLDAADKLQKLFNDLLNAAGQNFDQSGPEFRAIFQQVLQGLEEIAGVTSTGEKDLETIAAEMQDEINAAGARAKEFYDKIQEPLAAALADQARQAQDTIDNFKRIILGEGGQFASLADMINALNTKSDEELQAILDKIQEVLGGGPGTKAKGNTPKNPTEVPKPEDATEGFKAAARKSAHLLIQKFLDWVTTHAAGDGFRKEIKSKISELASSLANLLPFIDPETEGLLSKLEKEAKRDRGARHDVVQDLATQMLDKVPATAKGGLAMDDQIRRVAEAGNPELILPLNLQGIGVFVDMASRIIANSASLNQRLVDNVLSARSRALALPAADRGSAPLGSEAQQVTLNVESGAITIVQRPGESPTRLSEETLKALERSVMNGRLGKVIRKRVSQGAPQ